MTTVATTKEIAAPASSIWSVLADFGGVHRYHPRVAKSPLLSDENSGVGAKRRCEFYDDTSIVEEVTSWDEGRGFTVELSEISMPLKNVTARIGVEERGADRAAVTIEMTYTPKFGPVGWLMDRMMIRRMMPKMFASVLRGLEDHVRTGQEIGEDGILALRAVS